MIPLYDKIIQLIQSLDDELELKIHYNFDKMNINLQSKLYTKLSQLDIDLIQITNELNREINNTIVR